MMCYIATLLLASQVKLIKTLKKLISLFKTWILTTPTVLFTQNVQEHLHRNSKTLPLKMLKKSVWPKFSNGSNNRVLIRLMPCSEQYNVS
ncbi:Uncharacterised protein [Mycobacteroides abscessus subsp. abscessus]|nr:Uncharacterised protein [Mycobacteroides abscessus subsp. abscessus]